MLEFSTEISPGRISAAVRNLRCALGRSAGRDRPVPQDEFAALFGKKLAAVQRWEAGKNMPPGDVIIRMLQLCPDQESFMAFGVFIPQSAPQARKSSSQEEAGMGKGPMDTNDPELRKWHKETQEVVRFLGEQKRAGNRVAAEILRSMAQSVVRAAGIATEPGISRARRARMVEDEIRRLEKIIE